PSPRKASSRACSNIRTTRVRATGEGCRFPMSCSPATISASRLGDAPNPNASRASVGRICGRRRSTKCGETHDEDRDYSDGRVGSRTMTAPGANLGEGALTAERRALAAATTAHALHDGYTDLLYLLLPIWQAEFGLGYTEVGALRSSYTATMAALQIPSSLLA